MIAGCSSNGTEQPASNEQKDAQEADTIELEETESDDNNQGEDAISITEVPIIKLNDGYEMPMFGLGTWTLSDEEAENSTYHALKDGYRLIDTALYYGNHEGVGKGVRRAIEEGICTREDVFITSKVAPYMSGDFMDRIEQCNEELGLEYIDLMLIHQSGSRDEELYKVIEESIDKGIVRSLGISNYYTKDEYDRITANAEVLPVLIQNENHPFYQNTEIQEYVRKDGVFIESYYPLGGRGHTQDLFNNETILRLAEKYDKSSAQIILRWHLQAGYIVIPGSSNPDHIAENIDIFDFELTDEDMEKIKKLDTGNRYENW